MKKILLGISGLLLLLLLPLIIWLLQEDKPMKVAIIDKTVPTENYREHKGLSWILNHDQYGKEDGVRYEAARDYYGFMPDEKEQDYQIRDIMDLENDYDLIYLADTYGVYQEDLPWQDKDDKPSGEGSELVYGGLKMEEWQTVKQRVLDEGSDLVVEFNTFASPTEGPVSSDMEEFLGLEWSGWTGRYFPELAADAEVRHGSSQILKRMMKNGNLQAADLCWLKMKAVKSSYFRKSGETLPMAMACGWNLLKQGRKHSVWTRALHSTIGLISMK